MGKKRGKKKFKLQHVPPWLILIGAIGLLGYLYIGGEYGLWQHWKQHQKKQQLLREIAQLRAEKDSLTIVIERLRTDSSYIAQIAREKYFLGLPDEEIIRIIRKEE